MFGFFIKKPATGVLVIIAMLITGAVLAHKSKRTSPAAHALSLVKARQKKPVSDWRDKLDPDRAALSGGKLVQRLADGGKVTYTLDPELQAWAREYLRSHELPYAGMVMMDVESGRLLVMAGHSSNNPKVETRHLCLTPWAPAASVYKLITAAALLDRGVSPESTVCYHGGLRGLQPQHLRDSPRQDTTCKSLADAIARSINPIMGKLALRHLDVRRMEEWSHRFGFNRAIPFDLPVQPSRAVIPTGDLERARVAAGFWKTEASVLHGALIAGVAASRGLLVWPRIVESVTRADGRRVIPRRPEQERVMGRRAAAALARMMVTTTTTGTARRGFVSRRGTSMLPGIAVGGKTGSLSRSKPFLQYSWFVGFAPAQQPRVAFAVLLGNPERWRIKAHTAARVMLGRYLEAERATNRAVAQDQRGAGHGKRPTVRASGQTHTAALVRPSI